MPWKLKYGFLTLLVLIKVAQADLDEDIDENGYIMYCPCMGKNIKLKYFSLTSLFL